MIPKPEKRAPRPRKRIARGSAPKRTTRVKKRSDKRAGVERKDAAWAKAVKERAEHACEICGLGGKLDAHHIFGKKANPKLRWDLANGIGLTRDCHDWAHRNPLLLQAWIQTWAPERWVRLEAARLG